MAPWFHLFAPVRLSLDRAHAAAAADPPPPPVALPVLADEHRMSIDRTLRLVQSGGR